jgi:hypothetical protein
LKPRRSTANPMYSWRRPSHNEDRRRTATASRSPL